MPRRVKVPTLEMGDLQLFLIEEWSHGWGVLKGTVFGGLLSVVSKETLDHALHRWSKPLVNSLGIPPEGALRKVPQQCFRRLECPLYLKSNCLVSSPKMPWCFEPDGEFGFEVRKKAAEAIELWREGVYVVVVVEDL